MEKVSCLDGRSRMRQRELEQASEGDRVTFECNCREEVAVPLTPFAKRSFDIGCRSNSTDAVREDTDDDVRFVQLGPPIPMLSCLTDKTLRD